MQPSTAHDGHYAPPVPLAPVRGRFIGLADGTTAAAAPAYAGTAGSFIWSTATPKSLSSPSLRSTKHSARLGAPRADATQCR